MAATLSAPCVVALLSLLAWQCVQAGAAAAPAKSPAASATAGDVATAAAYLAKHNPKLLALLRAASVNDTAIARMRGVLLAPSDAAVDAFTGTMATPLPQLLRNPLLVDQVAAYHFFPGVKITPGQSPRPVLSRSAALNYAVRFYKDAKSGRAWLQDTQGNNVTLRQSPVTFGRLAVVPVDRVLMSGSYFANLEAALRLHPKFQQAYQLYKRGASAGLSSSGADSGGLTVFAPDNEAFKGAKVDVSSLSTQDAQRLLQFHTTKGVKTVPQLQSGSLATLLPDTSLKVTVGRNGTVRLPWSRNATIPRPLVTLVDASGRAANVTTFNVWAGQSVLHGINGVLQPGGAADAKPERKQGSRRLLERLQQEWQLLQARQHARRALLQASDFDPTSHFNGQWGEDNPATAFASQNTVQASYADYNDVAADWLDNLNEWHTWAN